MLNPDKYPIKNYSEIITILDKKYLRLDSWDEIQPGRSVILIKTAARLVQPELIKISTPAIWNYWQQLIRETLIRDNEKPKRKQKKITEPKRNTYGSFYQVTPDEEKQIARLLK